MLPSNKVVKKTAFTALKGRWKDALFANLIVIFGFAFLLVLPSVLLSVVAPFLAVAVSVGLFVLLFCPLLLGSLFFMRRLLWGQKDSPVLVFYYFGDFSLYISALKFSVLLFFRAFVCGIILMIPSLTARLLSENAFYIRFNSTMPSFAPSLLIVSYILEVAAAVALFFIMAKYFAAPFIFVSKNDIPPEEAIRLSLLVGKNLQSEFVLFVLGLVLWIILSFFVIPLPFTLPFLSACYCVFGRFSVARYNKTADSLNNSDNTPSFEAKF